MKKLMWGLLLFLAMSLPLFSQTTYTATGYGSCQNATALTKPLYCTAELWTGSISSGFITFYLVNNGTITITSGEVWLFNAADQQTAYLTDVTGTIDTTQQIVSFQFAGSTSGSATLGYKITPRMCSRYCAGPRVVITTGVVTIN